MAFCLVWLKSLNITSCDKPAFGNVTINKKKNKKKRLGEKDIATASESEILQMNSFAPCKMFECLFFFNWQVQQ